VVAQSSGRQRISTHKWPAYCMPASGGCEIRRCGFHRARRVGKRGEIGRPIRDARDRTDHARPVAHANNGSAAGEANRTTPLRP
jgi:hypothetical protein